MGAHKTVLTHMEWPVVPYEGNPQDMNVSRVGNLHVLGQLRAEGGVPGSTLPEITGTWYYTDKNIGNDSNDGLSWSSPFLTVAAGLAALSDYDGLVIGMGVYSEVNLSVNKEGVKIVGLGSEVDRTMIKGTNAANKHILTILGNRNEIAGICFKQLAAKQCIVLGAAANVYNVHIHNCRFYGTEGAASVATYGIAACQTGAEPDIPDFIYERNWFYGFTTAAIRAHGTRGTCRDNTIIILSAGDIGIECPMAVDGRPYMSVHNNKIMGVNDTDVGIQITNDVEAKFLSIEGNHVSRCAVPMTRARDTDHYVGNILGIHHDRYMPERNTWFVDENVDGGVTGDGRCPWSAVLTIAEAVALAGAYGTIKIAPAVYTEHDLNLNYAGMRLIAVNSAWEEKPSSKPEVMIKGTDTTVLVIVDANHCEIAGIHFKVVDAGKAIQVGDQDADSIHGLWVHDCNFIGDGGTGVATGTYAIAGYSLITEWADALIEKNRFLGWTTAAIQAHGTRMTIRNNVFWILTSADIGIVIGTGALFRPFLTIADNHFSGVSGGLGIVGCTGMDDDHMYIGGNRFSGAVEPCTQLAQFGEACVDNYQGVASGIQGEADFVA